MTPAIAYLPLEPVRSRYTFDLCNSRNGWMPNALKKAPWREFHYIHPAIPLSPDITCGAVLDAWSRCRYSLAQCAKVNDLIESGKLVSGDVLYLQDFWTPGLEAILYHCHLKGIKLRIYAMVHAQSVDPYDFTHDMQEWMRPIELSWANQMAGLFVASTIHKEELVAAGVTAPINVVGLPYGMQEVSSTYHVTMCKKANAVIYSSRIDKEKQPEFMLSVAKQFLKMHKDYEWWVTTSSNKLRSYNNEKVIPLLRKFAEKEPRFLIKEGLSKQDYHGCLSKAQIQFNCSLQDYVSWTLLEALHHQCLPVYPHFRSFPEVFGSVGYVNALYTPWDINSAVKSLSAAVRPHNYHAFTCSRSKMIPAYCSNYRERITTHVFHGSNHTLNLWNFLRG